MKGCAYFMHSCIFQISKKEIDKDKYIITEDYETYEDDFVGSVADYVHNVDREESIKWLSETNLVVVKKIREEYTILFKKGFKENYFEKRFNLFKKMSSELTFGGFIGTDKDNSVLLFSIKNALYHKYGFYFETDDYGRVSFDDLVRDYIDENNIYFLGGTVGYHC